MRLTNSQMICAATPEEHDLGGEGDFTVPVGHEGGLRQGGNMVVKQEIPLRCDLHIWFFFASSASRCRSVFASPSGSPNSREIFRLWV